MTKFNLVIMLLYLYHALFIFKQISIEIVIFRRRKSTIALNTYRDTALNNARQSFVVFRTGNPLSTVADNPLLARIESGFESLFLRIDHSHSRLFSLSIERQLCSFNHSHGLLVRWGVVRTERKW